MTSRQSPAYADLSRAAMQSIGDVSDPSDDRTAYALPAVRPGLCSRCGGRMWGDDIARGVCDSCTRFPTPDLRLLEVPAKYRWARLDQPIVPPGWDRPIIPEAARAKALAWADGEYDGPKNALAIACIRYERDERGNKTDKITSPTGRGKSSFAAAVARYVAEKRGLSVTWVHAGDLRGDHDDTSVPTNAKRRLLRAKLSVLDGLGKELAGAHNVAGWIPARAAPMIEYASEMYQQDQGIRIVTLDLPPDTLRDVYGADLVRRFGRTNPDTKREENATIVML